MLVFSYSSSNGAVITFGDNILLQSRGLYVIENICSIELGGYVESHVIFISYEYPFITLFEAVS